MLVPWRFTISSMYGIFTYIWFICMVNVGKYTIHGWYGTWNSWNKLVFDKKNDTRQKSARTTVPRDPGSPNVRWSLGCIITSSGRYLGSITFLRKMIRSLGTSHVVPLHQSQLSTFFGESDKDHHPNTLTSIHINPNTWSFNGPTKNCHFKKSTPKNEKSGRKNPQQIIYININIMKHLSQGFPYFFQFSGTWL